MVGATPSWREVQEGSWRLVEGDSRPLTLETEGWKNGPWRHDVAVFEHPDPVADHVCVIEISGDDAGATDDEVSWGISRAARLPVLTLFNVPNQPVFDLREDALLAFSFLQALENKDPEWPALVPMVRSVLAAMSAATEVSGGRWTSFVLTGASKRGWTTWLTAATGDPRIIGAAPRMFDNLRTAAQMQKQLVDWDGYSPMIEDYTAVGLQEMIAEGPASELARWLDPVTYAKLIDVPLLIVNGANDPFWCTDASSVYEDDLADKAAFVVCPDTRHVGRLPSFAAGAFGALCRAAVGESSWRSPAPHWDGRSWREDNSGAFGHRLWTARAEDGKFDTARWNVADSALTPEPRPDSRTAHFVELLMPGVGAVGPYSLTSHVVVSPPVS